MDFALWITAYITAAAVLTWIVWSTEIDRAWLLPIGLAAACLIASANNQNLDL